MFKLIKKNLNFKREKSYWNLQYNLNFWREIKKKYFEAFEFLSLKSRNTIIFGAKIQIIFTFKTSIWSSSIVRFKMLPISSGVEIDLFFFPNPAAMTFCAFLKKFKISLKFMIFSHYYKIRIFVRALFFAPKLQKNLEKYHHQKKKGILARKFKSGFSMFRIFMQKFIKKIIILGAKIQRRNF